MVHHHKSQEEHRKSKAVHSKEMERRLTEAIARATEIVGNLGGKIDIVIEMLIIPGICPLLNKYGHDFVENENIPLIVDEPETLLDWKTKA